MARSSANAKQTTTQHDIVARVMHDFKQGNLEQRNGAKVENPKQAIAIALHEAGASNRQSEADNRRALARTKRREKQTRAAERESGDRSSRAELYREARRRGIEGRSTMRKAELARALQEQRP